MSTTTQELIKTLAEGYRTAHIPIFHSTNNEIHKALLRPLMKKMYWVSISLNKLQNGLNDKRKNLEALTLLDRDDPRRHRALLHLDVAHKAIATCEERRKELDRILKQYEFYPSRLRLITKFELVHFEPTEGAMDEHVAKFSEFLLEIEYTQREWFQELRALRNRLGGNPAEGWLNTTNNTDTIGLLRPSLEGE